MHANQPCVTSWPLSLAVHTYSPSVGPSLSSYVISQVVLAYGAESDRRLGIPGEVRSPRVGS